MVSRAGGGVAVTPASHVKSEDILKRAVKNVDPETRIYHDDHPSYSILSGAYRHETVNHSLGEYARDGGIHTNTVEAEFSIFRPWWATYRGVSKEHTYLYCSHYQLLRNTRNMERVQRAGLILFPQTAIGPPTINQI
jgi:transposase-like protein